MPKVALLSLKGEKVKDIKLNDENFGIEPNNQVIYDAVVRKGASLRQGTHAVKDRSEVSGGGIKPWRQKGTGRARQGSIRSPQWRHGGVVFAPKPRDFSKKINKVMKQGAFVSAISQKIKADEFVVLDKIELAEPKTKLMAEVCKNLDAGKKALFVLDAANVNVSRASSNLKDVDLVQAELLNVYEMVRAGKMFVTVDALKKIEEANK